MVGDSLNEFRCIACGHINSQLSPPRALVFIATKLELQYCIAAILTATK